MPKNGKKHSEEATALVGEFIKQLEAIPDGCAERYPFEIIDELREEYGFPPGEYYSLNPK